jgi:acetolactate synthase regulatory subunit
MDTTTSPHQKSYLFCIEPDAPIATLESVLATVRRLGIDLLCLRSNGNARGMEVQIRLAAADEEALDLCRKRLHNMIGVLAIRELRSQPAVPELCFAA